AWVMLVLNLPFKALMFLTLMRPSLVLFLVLWLKLDRKSGSAGMPRPISYAVFCLKKKKKRRRQTQDVISKLLGRDTPAHAPRDAHVLRLDPEQPRAI